MGQSQKDYGHREQVKMGILKEPTVTLGKDKLRFIALVVGGDSFWYHTRLNNSQKDSRYITQADEDEEHRNRQLLVGG